MIPYTLSLILIVALLLLSVVFALGCVERVKGTGLILCRAKSE